MVHGGSKNNNKCENCEKVFASYKGLREHIKMIHKKTDYEKFKCFVCGNYFTKMSTLKRHIWSVHHISSKDIPNDPQASVRNRNIIKAVPWAPKTVHEEKSKQGLFSS